MAKPNYSFEKRQRDLQKQQKKVEKQARKAAAKDDAPAAEEATDSPATSAPAEPGENTTGD